MAIEDLDISQMGHAIESLGLLLNNRYISWTDAEKDKINATLAKTNQWIQEADTFQLSDIEASHLYHGYQLIEKVRLKHTWLQ